MVKPVSVRRAGGSVSTTLPKDVAARLQVAPGDQLLAVETDRAMLLTPYDLAITEAVAIAAKAAKRYRNALRALAR